MSRRHFLGLTIAMLAMVTGSIFAAASARAGGGGCDERLTDGHGTKVDIKDLCFITTILRVQQGDSVTWTNRGASYHTVSGANGSWGSYDPLYEGKSVTRRFDTNGVYPYFCLFHPGMVGAIVVGDGSGPGAATGDGGVPAGVMLTKGGGAPSGANATGGVTAKTSGTERGTIALAASAGASAVAIAGAAVAFVARSGRRRTQSDAAI